MRLSSFDNSAATYSGALRAHLTMGHLALPSKKPSAYTLVISVVQDEKHAFLMTLWQQIFEKTDIPPSAVGPKILKLIGNFERAVANPP